MRSRGWDAPSFADQTLLNSDQLTGWCEGPTTTKWSDERVSSVCCRAVYRLTEKPIDSTEFGLGSSVWGNDLQRVQRIADGLYNGMGKA